MIRLILLALLLLAPAPAVQASSGSSDRYFSHSSDKRKGHHERDHGKKWRQSDEDRKQHDRRERDDRGRGHAVPEPSSALSFGAGAALLTVMRRRSRAR